MRLVASARSADFARAAARRRREPTLARCHRRILGLLTVETRCPSTCAA